jgi:hypothetical protein
LNITTFEKYGYSNKHLSVMAVKISKNNGEVVVGRQMTTKVLEVVDLGKHTTPTYGLKKEVQCRCTRCDENDPKITRTTKGKVDKNISLVGRQSYSKMTNSRYKLLDERWENVI